MRDKYCNTKGNTPISIRDSREDRVYAEGLMRAESVRQSHGIKFDQNLHRWIPLIKDSKKH